MDITKGGALSAQVSVLGVALIAPELVGAILAETGEEDFPTAEALTVYRAVRELFISGRAVDPVTVRGLVGKEYDPFLIQAMDLAPSQYAWREHVELLHVQARMHALRSMAERLMLCTDPDAAADIVGKMSGALCARRGVRIVGAKEGFVERQAEKREYISYGIGALDRRVFTQKGDFVVIGGRPSAGKTALAVNFAYRMAMRYRVGFFSLETSADKIYDRAVSFAAQVEFGRIKRQELTEDDWHALNYSRAKIENGQFDVIEASGMSVQDIAAIALERRYEIIFVDYLQLVRAGGKNRTEEVSRISMDLHTFAQRNGVTVIALAQLSRPERTQEAAKPPTMASLRESGQIEQDADVVMLLYLENAASPGGDRKLRVAKNKEGGTGVLTLGFAGMYQAFVEKTEGAGLRGLRMTEGRGGNGGAYDKKTGGAAVAAGSQTARGNGETVGHAQLSFSAGAGNENGRDGASAREAHRNRGQNA